MSFRSDLDAAHARISSLEGELHKARSEIERLSQEADAEDDPPMREEPRAKRRFGRVRYKPPRSLFPLMRLYLRAIAVAFHKRPSLREPSSNALIVWVLHALILVPLVYAVWLPLYLVLLVGFVVPWAGAISLAGTVVLTPFLLLSRLRIEGKGSDPDDTGWLHGDITDDTAAIYLWVLLAVTMPPLLPVYIPLLPS